MLQSDAPSRMGVELWTPGVRTVDRTSRRMCGAEQGRIVQRNGEERRGEDRRGEERESKGE